MKKYISICCCLFCISRKAQNWEKSGIGSEKSASRFSQATNGGGFKSISNFSSIETNYENNIKN